MSKKTPVKKSKRRLKRSVRRSLAAVLMITAIAVAAIPVPENAAATGDNNARAESDVKVLQNYAYPQGLPFIDLPYNNDPVSLKLKTKTENGVEVPAETVYTTYFITPSTSGGRTVYTMNWQFDFFMRKIQKVNYGIICDYNYTAGHVSRLEVPKNPIYQYVTVPLATVNDFIKKHYGSGPVGGSGGTTSDGTTGSGGTAGVTNPGTVVVKDWGRPGEDTEKDDKIKLYFGDKVYDDQVAKYQKYDADLAQYRTDLAAWNANPNHTADTKPTMPTEPDLVTKYASEFGNSINEQWRLFYCEKSSHTYDIKDESGNVTATNTISLKGYILEEVVDAKNSGAQALPVYIPRRLSDTDDDGADVDEYGFLVQDRTSIKGIAERAFYMVQDVDVIALDSDVQYIGDSAFQGSFIQGIETYAENIGNRAFYDCKYLTNIKLQQGVSRIGTEAFAKEPLLTSVEFPASLTYIGLGAFANCSTLRTLDFSKTTAAAYIDDYAFYDDIGLTTVNFTKDGTTPVEIATIGKAAFAVRQGITGSLVDFTMPSGISKVKAKVASSQINADGEPIPDESYNPFGSASEISDGVYTGLGDYIFAGRVNLQKVTMPSSFGSATEATVPDYLFFNCIALERVVFPHTGTTCGLATYNPDKLFATVSNTNFCVEGPELMQPTLDDPAYPRKATWAAVSAVSKVIPYIYYDRDGVEYREVSDGTYLECIDQNGILIDCKLKPPVPDVIDDIYLPIPAEVAGVKVKGIASNCFKDDRLNQHVVVLTIMDGSELATIDSSVFKGWHNLEKVYIGDSVRSIGAEAFADCEHLVDVSFNTEEQNAADFSVGANAFNTGGTALTFHGLIDANYGPYKYAMQPDTRIGAAQIRVCYKSMLPSYQTVMYDGKTGDVTLLDYPKYDQVGNLLGEEYATKHNENWQDMGYKSAEAYYNAKMEQFYYDSYSGDEWNSMRTAFKEAWDKAATADEVYNDFTVYGPWVTEDYVNTTFLSTAKADENINVSVSAMDWLFKPLVAEAALTETPLPYFDKYPYDVYANYTRPTEEKHGSYMTSTQDEELAFQATQRMKVPDGVTSIDVFGYVGDEGATAAQYLSARVLGSSTRNMYYDIDDSGRKSEVELPNAGTDYHKDVIAGLFSGSYADKKADDPDVNPDKGNDRLREIDLNQVKSLPAYAFDNCDKLEKVTIGAACTDIGQLPFRGCPSLKTLNVADTNTKYFAENRLLYERNLNDPGYSESSPVYTIVECLESRGEGNDNVTVTAAADTGIANVKYIARAAFEECNNLSTINLTDAEKLTEIPENCFKGCDALDEVRLPASLNKINKGAFYDDSLRSVRVPGREVFISTEAFKDEGSKKPNPTHIITYNDSSARRYADTYQTAYNLVWEDIGELWSVNFYDYDGRLVKAMSVKDGDGVKPKEIPEVSRDGYEFIGWLGTNGVDIENDEITRDTDFIAQYRSISAMVDGKWIVTFTDGMTGEPFWPAQYVEDGKTMDSAPTEANVPYHEGYKFLKFSKDFAGEITSNMDVVALFEVDPTANNGGNTTSGGSTTTSGGTSNSGNSSSSGSTSTSGSSTSTTSSTGEKARHTVTVVNGYGSGSYAEGETVIIVANEPAAGQKFSQWRTESEGVELVMILASATTFVMPANNVLVTAEFTAGSTTPSTTLPSPVTGTVATRTGGNTTSDSGNGNTRVDITKPGISNKNLATANVNGSTDNFIVKISETPEATQAVINALSNKYGNIENILYYAMDISLYDSTGTTKITDTSGLSVDITIPLPDALVAYGGNNMMGAVVNGDQLEDMSERFTTIGGVPCISFTATHFSPYTIYVDTQNLSEGLLDITPKTGDPIHPKWFLSIGLASLSIILFMKKDKKAAVKTA
ncbi:MAG: leucine-rich repeat protein [Clostridium sp.]|nr:leucine-rich repeat protein [Clostridium sp.]